MPRSSGYVVRPPYPKRLHVLIVGTNVGLGDPLPVPTFLTALFNDLVVNVGVVPDEGHIVAFELHVPSDRVKRHCGPGVPDVTVVVDRHTAGVDAHLGRIYGSELLFPSCQGVVNAKGHKNSRG